MEKYKHKSCSITIWDLNIFLKIAEEFFKVGTKLFVKEAIWKMKLLEVQRREESLQARMIFIS